MFKYSQCVGVLVAVFLLSSAVFAAEPGANWPKNMAPYLKAKGNCSERERAHLQQNSEPLGPISTQTVSFYQEQACRLVHLRRAFLKEPSKFCPGVKPESFGRCYSKMLSAQTPSPGIDLNGMALMHHMAILYLKKNKASYKSKKEMANALVDWGWVSLDHLEKRVKPDDFAKNVTVTAKNKTLEIESLRANELASAKNFAGNVLDTADDIIKKMEDRANQGRNPASSDEKNRVTEYRRKYDSFAKKWKTD